MIMVSLVTELPSKFLKDPDLVPIKAVNSSTSFMFCFSWEKNSEPVETDLHWKVEKWMENIFKIATIWRILI